LPRFSGLCAYPASDYRRPSITDAKTALGFCLDYARRAVPASGLAEAIGTAAPRRAVFDHCLASYGWAE